MRKNCQERLVRLCLLTVTASRSVCGHTSTLSTHSLLRKGIHPPEGDGRSKNRYDGALRFDGQLFIQC